MSDRSNYDEAAKILTDVTSACEQVNQAVADGVMISAAEAEAVRSTVASSAVVAQAHALLAVADELRALRVALEPARVS